ncbi:hypothetical protein BJ741DRAFT_639260 [Chytriomyces cf. hyalinus JEL632]|nr:hypothetical protein BJ741DRAFT_639260 [Chytriomyces cf. hyalinus JEL632]
MKVPLFSPSIAAPRRMTIHGIPVVNAAAIISVISILLTGLYASDMTSFGIHISADIGSNVTAILNSNNSNASLLPRLSNTMGAWFDLATYADAKAFLECNIFKSAEPENCCSKHHIELATQQQFRIRTGDGNATVNPRNSAACCEQEDHFPWRQYDQPSVRSFVQRHGPFGDSYCGG